MSQLDFNKGDGLVPAVIQDNLTSQVLMLGFMDEEAYAKTVEEKVVTFFSRTKQRLWMKGETSGHTLEVVSIHPDCDADTILVKVNPNGPTCHRGTTTCFDNTSPEANNQLESLQFLGRLEALIQERKTNPQEKSYTNHLFASGIQKIAQKVGEEAVEVVIDAVAGNKEPLTGEAADLLYHLLVLLAASDLQLSDVVKVLQARHKVS
ncbi:bifunctional phosphoribosyl-AMP cyclohydrolase/phosphoribosyl-ATP diphosphatase HisIE [soil metagenome]